MRTLGQKRAEFALEKVVGIEQSKKDKFKPFSAGAPSMILQNGFGQAIAFWVAKGKDEHKSMMNILREWLVSNGFSKGNDDKTFIRNLAQMEQRDYLNAQKEALALLEWVKRYSNAGL